MVGVYGVYSVYRGCCEPPRVFGLFEKLDFVHLRGDLVR